MSEGLKCSASGCPPDSLTQCPTDLVRPPKLLLPCAPTSAFLPPPVHAVGSVVCTRSHPVFYIILKTSTSTPILSTTSTVQILSKIQMITIQNFVKIGFGRSRPRYCIFSKEISICAVYGPTLHMAGTPKVNQFSLAGMTPACTISAKSVYLFLS